jgi:hypothetical protein
MLVAGIAAQLHNHDGAQEATCLVCHATERATVVVIALDAGKAKLSEQESAPVAKAIIVTLPDAHIASAPRAPPAELTA